MCQMLLQMLSHFYRIFFNSSSEKDKAGCEETGDKITALEQKIKQLEEQNKELQKKLDYNRNKEAALQKVLCNYDNLLKKVIMEKNSAAQQDESSIHLANLESAFYDLLQKYEKAKLVVYGFQKNESALKRQVEEYEAILEGLRTKFTAYKTLSGKGNSIGSAKQEVDNCGDSKGKKRRLLTAV